MTHHKIEPHRVTKPMQLLAVWLIGMIITEGLLLTAAQMVNEQNWVKGVLVVAAILNIPLFLFFIFILQTKFRPQLPEDVYYSQWLDRQTSSIEFSTINNQNLYRPYVFSKEVTKEQSEEVKEEIQIWHPILVAMGSPGFFAMHGWYYEKEQYREALTCLDIAISRGMASSKNYSFRAANLRVLGRLVEAEYSAQLALRLDPTNIDAYYNLAVIYKYMGRQQQSLTYLEKVLASGQADYYDSLIRSHFPHIFDEGKEKSDITLSSLKVDRTVFTVASLTEASDEKAYWLSRTPHERLQYMELLRRINYGYRATARLQRVFEFAQR